MKLECVLLKDFRQFYGKQEAEFSMADDLNVTVFHGMNGTGKTSLFSAINWCLYGSGVEGIGELVSRRALAEAGEGETVKAEVLIMFIHQARRYIAKRSLTVVKSGQKGRSVGPAEFSLSQTRASGDSEPKDNPRGFMNWVLPANVQPYFFFDGEKMDDLTRAESREVEEAIRNIMRLPALERAETHLNDIAAAYRREIRKQGSPKVGRLTSEEDQLRAQKERAVKRRDELKEEIRLARQKIVELEAKLRATEVTRNLQEERDRIEDLLEQSEKQERDKVDLVQRLVNRSYLNLLPEAARQALEVLDEKRERGLIPSDIRRQLVKDLLENLECICGRPFQANDEVYARLSSLLKRATSNELNSEVSRLGGLLRALSTITSNQMTSLVSLARDRAGIESRMDQLYKQKDDIERQLKNAPEEEIAGLERQRAKFQRSLERAIAEQGSIETTTSNIDLQIERKRKEKREAEAKEKKLTQLTRREELAQQAADAVTRIKEEFFEQTRCEVEAATKKVFEGLAWKQEHFQDVRLDHDFRLEVIDRWGMPTRKELSAGERQILSLSFIAAMAGVSGEAAPLVMDTPFGRLSGDHLSAVAENLPDLTSQLILFVTDREWDEASRTGLEPRAGAQFELKFDMETGCTTIEEVSFGYDE
jgi:DNA sulfur modification protein DndD